MQADLLFKLDQDPRGAGLRCDSGGLFLGRNALLSRDRQGTFEARPAVELEEVFGRAYGDETNWESRIRSVKLVANALNKGEVARAMMTAVLMRLPDPDAIRIAGCTIAKAGFNQDEPRTPGGQWAREGSASADLNDAFHIAATLDSARASETGNDNEANLVLAAAESEDEADPRFGIGGNYPPLDELIPQRLVQSPAGPPLQFLDNLLGISQPGDEANLAVAELKMRALLQHIRAIDPNYVFESIEPPGGLAGMSWEGRLNLINGLQADLAAAIYRIKGDIKPLQEVTFEFMQRATNAAYDKAMQRYRAGLLNPLQPPQLAIGNDVDGAVRRTLNEFYNGLGISTDLGSAVRVNRWAPNSSVSPITYRIPDARVGNLAFDVSLEAKKPSDSQIIGFFNADFKPVGVVIVRPNQLGSNSSYIIWRSKGWR